MCKNVESDTRKIRKVIINRWFESTRWINLIKKKKEPLLSIIGDWLERFVFTVSSKSLRRCWPIRRTSDGHLPAFSRSMLDLSLSLHPPIFPSSLLFSLTLAHFHPFPFFFPPARSRTGSLLRWYIFSTLASISRHFITIKRARHALSPCRIMVRYISAWFCRHQLPFKSAPIVDDCRCWWRWKTEIGLARFFVRLM